MSSWNLSDIRRLKIGRTYTVAEIAQTLGVSRNTVRNWHGRGMQPIDDGRPTLFCGDAVQEFLRAARAKRKQKCPPGHFYCLRCRAPRAPALQMADYVPRTDTKGNLRAICPECGGLIHRAVSLAKLEAVCGGVDVAFPEGQ